MTRVISVEQRPKSSKTAVIEQLSELAPLDTSYPLIVAHSLKLLIRGELYRCAKLIGRSSINLASRANRRSLNKACTALHKFLIESWT
jgi:hypothetical protein